MRLSRLIRGGFVIGLVGSAIGTPVAVSYGVALWQNRELEQSIAEVVRPKGPPPSLAQVRVDVWAAAQRLHFDKYFSFHDVRVTQHGSSMVVQIRYFREIGVLWPTRRAAFEAQFELCEI